MHRSNIYLPLVQDIEISTIKKTQIIMKKVSFFLSALAMVAFVACNNAAEEATVEETVEEVVVEEAPAEEASEEAATEEVVAEGEEASAE